ncbi:conserved hypothetical protein [Neospora caninum Liverpool]|uniref:Uncharacterized protein n=1 Tax=Neospora caninum (strain Liverpool) TaxID=572307 RepID=F0VBL9_NEOCL|nr:conserved hypothetical protein [Neospora caninum Liverpool]CBZ51003.1 conserved hypothetical protein [Neospora caninum Liverpool]CEL68308.1 TPA: hypothetical protein BN1204_040780 [Neospora caninum Liverpool]|eukprot:XP_003881036.1 conserved hypothetical protein [Neospora caninum Liverpool]
MEKKRENGGHPAAKGNRVQLKKAKGTEDAAVPEADASAQKKQAEAEAKLRAICAAFWGDDEEESVPACSPLQDSSTGDGEVKTRSRSSDCATETAGASSHPERSAVHESRSTGKVRQDRSSKKQQKAFSTLLGDDVPLEALGASLSVSQLDCGLPSKKRLRGEKGGFLDTVSSESSPSDSRVPPVSVSRRLGLFGEDFPASGRSSATADDHESHAHATSGGFSGSVSGKENHAHACGGHSPSSGSGAKKSGRSRAGQGASNAVSAAEAARRKEEEERRKEKEMFDETVRDIRKLVYPHLGTFQRRQYVSTALRALGAKQLKEQRRPLPELLSRQAKTKANIAKRLEEEKHLGVSTHLDKRGNLQTGERYKKKQRDQKRGRQDLRNTLSAAGHLDRKQVKKLRLKTSS